MNSVGDVIDMNEWLRANRKRDGRDPERKTDDPAPGGSAGSEPHGEVDGATLVDDLHDLAESRGSSLDALLEDRLLRERRDRHGLHALGALARESEFPPDLDDALRKWATARDVTLAELLQILLCELRDAAHPPLL